MILEDKEIKKIAKAVCREMWDPLPMCFGDHPKSIIDIIVERVVARIKGEENE